MARIFPNCCGSEDGHLVYGTDLVTDCDVMVELWVCETCGVITVTEVVEMQHTMDPRPC